MCAVKRPGHSAGCIKIFFIDCRNRSPGNIEVVHQEWVKKSRESACANVPIQRWVGDTSELRHPRVTTPGALTPRALNTFPLWPPDQDPEGSWITNGWHWQPTTFCPGVQSSV